MKPLDKFTQAYLVCALWSSIGEDDRPLDETYGISDFAPEALDMAIADCAKFQAENAAELWSCDLEQAGHDFWLTRNRHGAGFWDGDYEKELGEILTKASLEFGETDIYEADDGFGTDAKLYFSR